jgi:hypothetical protein
MGIKNLRSMWTFIFTAIGGVIIIFGAYFQYQNWVDDQKSALEKEEKRAKDSERILKKATQIISSQKKVIDQTTKIADLQKELNLKNDKIGELQDKALAQITGGKGVPKLSFLVTGNRLIVRLANTNNLPIKSVVIRLKREVWDYSIEHNKKYPKGMAPPRYAEPDETITFDELYKGDLGLEFNKEIKDLRFPKNYKSISYDYTVNWQNGFYEGTFNVNTTDNLLKITDDMIISYTESFDYSKAVNINNRFSNYNPEPAK